jgi:ERCC4-type nuclease
MAYLEQVKAKKPLRTRTGEALSSDAQTLEYILSGFPGVDTVTSRAILSELGSLENVFSSDKKKLQQVKGVGPKIAGTIRRLLTTEYPKV